jgi:DNA-binding MarR family transcriptional regulator
VTVRARSRATVELAERLHSVAIRLLRRVRVEDEAAGLSGPRLSALSVVVFAGPLTIGELAAAEQVRPPTMTRLVSALEEDGLVRRESDAADARLVRVVETAKGRRVMLDARARRIRGIASMLSALTPQDLSALDRGVEGLSEVLASSRH